ncbi:MAG: ABC transporter permease subunit [Oscillospiraceae bacterium]|jgi:phosphonate transport system permease protein
MITAAKEKELASKSYITKNIQGKIRIAAKNKSSLTIKLTLIILSIATVYAFLTFDYKNIDFGEAMVDTLKNIGTAFLNPRLKYDTFLGALYQLLITFSLGVLSTLLGTIIAFFGSLLCAKNIAKPQTANIVKSIVAFVRAVPTILWVLIFAVSAGLGSVAAVIGLTFHSASYLIKAYSESIEEMDYGTIEALKASGASYWQIVFQAIVPASISYIVAWTFMRFEINFANAVAMGAAAGAGGIGYSLFMSGSFYFDLRETGFLTLIIVVAVIILEAISTKLKEKVK